MKHCFLSIIFCFLASFVTAQRVEFGVFAGGSLYYGDISSNTSRLSNNLQPTRFTYSALLRWNISNYFAAKATFGQMNLGGADMYSVGTRSQREMSFSSKTNTAGLSVEIKLNEIINKFISTPIEPFVGGGMAIINAQPKVYHKGILIDENTSVWENGLTADNINQKAVMSSSLFANAGLIFPMSDFLKIGVEGTMARSNTDFMDGVSTPSNFKLFNNDWYMTGGVSVYFNLSGLSGGSGFGNGGSGAKNTKCYKF